MEQRREGLDGARAARVGDGLKLSGRGYVELENERLLVIGLEDLRRDKRATGRTKDKDDLRRLSAAAILPELSSPPNRLRRR